MELIADILLICGAAAAAAYCIVLSRRLRRFTDLEQGVGGAIAVLSAQVDDMTKTLKVAQVSAAGSAHSLDQLTGRAESAARRLEMLVAAMHDIPETPAKLAQAPPKADAAPQAELPQVPDPPQDAAVREDAETAPQFLSNRSRVQEAAE